MTRVEVTLPHTAKSVRPLRNSAQLYAAILVKARVVPQTNLAVDTAATRRRPD